MKAEITFSELLTSAKRSWDEKRWDEVMLSMALPIHEIDTLQQLPLLAAKESFRLLWDISPGRSIAVAGKCQNLDLTGPKRFEIAQRFSDSTLGRITDITPETPAQARPKIFLKFSFFEQTAERERIQQATPAVQAVLPRWQLTNQGRSGWLRITGITTNPSEARDLTEELWLMRESLSNENVARNFFHLSPLTGISHSEHWQDFYKPALRQGLDLVNKGELQKLVLAVRQSIHLDHPLEPLTLLSKLRKQQAGSCRFLWQNSTGDAFFGASPERLLSIYRGQLHSDALAGTAGENDDGEALMQSEKDRREHELVVQSISAKLIQQGLKPKCSRKPKLAKHGKLLHLHTPITAKSKNYSPLQLANVLHPTPAVAGLPLREAMAWLRTLEPFERGCYAAPIGWIDSFGDAEFRVAIRSGKTQGKVLEITAGAGLVKGSVADRELKEVGLKLAVLAGQLELKTQDSVNNAIT